MGTPQGLSGTSRSHTPAPFSAGAIFGKTGEKSGLFNNFRVPFRERIRVTVTLPPREPRFWLILRGHSAAIVSIDGHALPSGARLRSHENTLQTVPPNALLPLVYAPSTVSGAIYLTVLAISNYSNLIYQEGCIRSHEPPSKGIAGCASSRVRFLISSGTEDYFLGTWYFDKGMYTTPVAGVTWMDTEDLDYVNGAEPGDPVTNVSQQTRPRTSNRNATVFSAYRLHDVDPLWFRNGLCVTWRNSDPLGCDLSRNRTEEAVKSVQARSLVLWYEW